MLVLEPNKMLPNVFSPREEKITKEFGLNMFRYIWGDFCGNDNEYLNSWSLENNTNYRYAQAMQDVEQYKPRVTRSGDTSHISCIRWENDATITKLIEVFIGQQLEQRYKISVDALDHISKQKYDEERDKAHAQYLMHKFHNEKIKPITGQESPYKENVADTPEEIDLHFELKFKLAHEIALEKSLTLIEYINEQNEFERKVRYQLIVHGEAGSKTWTDDKGIHYRAIDYRNLVHPRITELGFQEDLWYTGERLIVSLGELKYMAKGELTDENLADIYEAAIKINPDRVRIGTNGWTSDYEVDVLNAVFVSVENKYHQKIYDEDGNYSISEMTEHPKDNDIDEVNILSEPIKTFYEGYYVIGTNFIFGYGLAKNALIHNSELEGQENPFAIYKHSERSIIRRCQGTLDEVTLLSLKMQLMAANIKALGLSIDVSALEKVGIQGKGGKNLQPLELISLYEVSGDVLYRSDGLTNGQANYNPIREIATGQVDEVNKMITTYNFYIQKLSSIIGLNKLSDASTPATRIGEGIADNAIQQTNNAQRTLNDAWLKIYQETAKRVHIGLNNFVRYNKPFRVFSKAIGDYNRNVIEYTKDDAAYDLGLRIQPKPTAEERQLFNQDLQLALKAQDITVEDKIYIDEVYDENPKLACQIINIRAKKKKEEEKQEKKRDIDYNTEQQQKSAQQAHQLKLNELEAQDKLDESKWNREIKKMTIEYDLKTKFENSKSDNKIEEKVIDRTHGTITDAAIARAQEEKEKQLLNQGNSGQQPSQNAA